MKLILLFILLSSLLNHLQCRPQSGDSNPPSILKNTFDMEENGGYYFSVQTSDGFQQEARGEVKDESLSVKGSYSLTDQDSVGFNSVIEYTADKDGFKANHHFQISQPQSRSVQPSIASLSTSSSVQLPTSTSSQQPHDPSSQSTTQPSASTKRPSSGGAPFAGKILTRSFSTSCLASLCGTSVG